MINLLSDIKKAEIRAGRANVIILNYIFMFMAAFALLIGILGVSYFTLSVSRTQAQQHAAQNAQDTVAYKDTEAQAKVYRDNLATAKQILDKEVVYSKLMVKVSQSVPEGVVLDDLSLDASTIGTPTTFKAHARTQADAIALKTSFEKETNLFSDVHFEQITFEDEGSQPEYPITITLGLTINKGALQ